MAKQLEFYFPKTKSKHMATPVTGKVYPSKGGTVRYGVQASMNGSMSLPKYVKENEFNNYGFSVVKKYPQEFLDAFYDFDSNPTADTQDDETVAIAYQAWYQEKAENEVLNAEVNVGEKRVMSRKDYDIDNELSGFSNMEVGDIDLEDYQDEITESVEDEVIEAIRESVDDAMPISDGESISSSVNVDTELEITVPISGDIDYDWTANETYEDDRHDDEWNAETVSFHGENYQNHLKVVKKAPYGGIGSLFGIGGDTELGGFSTSELTGSSAIHGDFDSASLNYSGHQNLQVRAETFNAECEHCEGEMTINQKQKCVHHKICKMCLKEFGACPICDLKRTMKKHGYLDAESVGSPSPSSPLEEVPATVPSPAEPTNESFNAENEKVYRGMPTDPDIPTILIDGPFGEEMWAFYEDGKLNKDPKQYQNRDGEMCAACEGDISLEYARSSRGYRYCEDCWEMVSVTKRGYHAEMDELDDTSSIIRNQVGDMVGMVELDENDEDIEKVDVDIIDDDGEKAYEGTLGAETFNAPRNREYPEYNEEKREYEGTIKEIYKDPKTNEIRVKGRWFFPQGGEWVEYDERGCQFEGCSQMGSPEWYDEDYCDTPCYNGIRICGKNKTYIDTFMGRQSLSNSWKDGAYGTFCQSLTEDEEGMERCNDCDYEASVYGAETFESQGKNTKMILGITALAVGLGLWKGKEILSISEKIRQSMKK